MVPLIHSKQSIIEQDNNGLLWVNTAKQKRLSNRAARRPFTGADFTASNGRNWVWVPHQAHSLSGRCLSRLGFDHFHL